VKKKRGDIKKGVFLIEAKGRGFLNRPKIEEKGGTSRSNPLIKEEDARKKTVLPCNSVRNNSTGAPEKKQSREM